jgi:CRP/FNR family transcriptional regulator, nitrogen oxide reductase regulator
MVAAESQEFVSQAGQEIDLRTMIEANLPSSRPDSALSLVASADVREAGRGEVFWRQGEPVRLTLLIRGHGGFWRTTAEGQRVIVGIANPGELYGITSVSATISTVEMVALTDSLVATWDGPVLRRVVVDDPGLALNVVDRLGSFLNILTEKVDGFLHQDARRRVVRVLSRHRDLFFGDPPILSRGILPGLVGTSREMTGSVVRRLEREGMIARVGRTGLKLLDPARLDHGA